MTKKARAFNNLLLVFGCLCILYYLGMGLAVRFGQSLLFLWPLVGCLCLLRYFAWRYAWKKGKKAPLPRWFLIPLRIAIGLFLAFFLLVEGFIFAGAFQKAPQSLETIIVLGARVNEDGPSGSLRQRVATAAQYLKDNPDTECIVSGGQGEDEPMSEASCMKDLLIEAGIDEGRIRTEEESTDTVENLENSFAMLSDSDQAIGIVSNDFHICRALYIGEQLGDYELYGIPAQSTTFGFIHYAAREFCGLVVSWVTGELPFLPFFGIN